MSNIVLSQPGGVGTLTADGNIQAGVRCYLSASGVTAVSWTLTSVPTGSTAVARLHERLGWYFDPDVKSETAYAVRMTDSVAATHDNSFYASGRPISPDPRVTSDPLYAEWFGVKADGREVSDGIATAGSRIFRSATLNATPEDVGKSFKGRMAVTRASGTITTTLNSINATGAGTNYAVDLPKIANDVAATYQPASGGAIYIVGAGYVVAQYVDAGTQAMTFYNRATATVVNAPWYYEPELIGTVTRVLSATEIELSVAATITESNVVFYLGTDDTTALDDCLRFGFENGKRSVRLPGGNISLSSNLVYSNRTGMTIFGPTATRCTIQDLRRISTEYPFPEPRSAFGVLSFSSCDGIRLQSIGYNARLPADGVIHSAGGQVNNSGARMGFYMHNCTNSSYVDCRSEGYGARDEHLMVDGESTNFLFDSCVVVNNNNVSLNMNGNFAGGVATPNGIRITNCIATGILAGCGTIFIDHCEITTGGDARRSASLTLSPIGHATVDTCTFHDINVLFAGTSLLDVFGSVQTDSSIHIINNKFIRCNGLWDAGHGAPIKILSAAGSVLIANNMVDSCTSSPAGRFVEIAGALTGRIILGPNTLRGRVACGMTIGYFVDATVPVSAVLICPGSFFGESITTKWSLGATCEFPVDRGILMEELTVAPPAPPANQGVLYLLDNGAGKTVAYILFATGAAQQVAIQP